MPLQSGIPVHKFGSGLKALSLEHQAFVDAAFVETDDNHAKVICKYCRSVSGTKGNVQTKGACSVSRRLGHLAVQCPELEKSPNPNHQAFVLQARLAIGDSQLNKTAISLVKSVRDEEIKRRKQASGNDATDNNTAVSSQVSSSTFATGPLDKDVRKCSSTQKDIYDDLVANLIYEEGLDLCLVEKPAFRELIKGLHPGYFNAGIPGRFSLANGMLAAHYNRDLAATNAHLNSCDWIVILLDGWKNEKGDQLKILVGVDPYGIAWALDAIDLPGKAGCGKRYFKALSVGLSRENATGHVNDWPRVMQNAAKRVRAHFPGKVMNPCTFHGIDGGSPPALETDMFKSSLAAVNEVVKHFKTYDRPSGILRRLREAYNERERNQAREQKRTPVRIPTLKLKGQTRKLSALNPFCSFIANLDLMKSATLHPDYKRFVNETKKDSAAMTSIRRTAAVLHDYVQVCMIEQYADTMKPFGKAQRVSERNRSNLSDAYVVMRQAEQSLDDNIAGLPEEEISRLKAHWKAKVPTYQGSAMSLCVWLDPRIWEHEEYRQDLNSLAREAYDEVKRILSELRAANKITSIESKQPGFEILACTQQKVAPLYRVTSGGCRAFHPRLVGDSRKYV